MERTSQLQTPVAIFFFKRAEKTALIVNAVAQVRPRKLYLISDGPRTAEEATAVDECRRRVEQEITWPCEVIRDYAETNRGVFDRIGLGAQRVLAHEKRAIFLEDDNLPDATFFRFCEEMLDRYADNDDILWVCGTNYLRDYQPIDGSSYVFTRHLLPCGWASWSHKFSKFYESDLALWDDPQVRSGLRSRHESGALFRQNAACWTRERNRILRTGKPNSWDYQMSFTLRLHGLYGIAPRVNLIRNIGADEFSTHGGTSLSNIMTRRFCEVPTVPMRFPLRHPESIQTDPRFERQIGRIILLPYRYRIKAVLNRALKRLLFIDQELSLTGTLRQRFGWLPHKL